MDGGTGKSCRRAEENEDKRKNWRRGKVKEEKMKKREDKEDEMRAIKGPKGGLEKGSKNKSNGRTGGEEK